MDVVRAREVPRGWWRSMRKGFWPRGCQIGRVWFPALEGLDYASAVLKRDSGAFHFDLEWKANILLSRSSFLRTMVFLIWLK